MSLAPRLGRRRTPTFRQQIQRPKPLAPEASPWFWTPQKVGARPAPPDFAARLHELDPNLAVCWNPVSERWQVWTKKPTLTRTGGWLLLFIVQNDDGSYRPLDERVFARLYEASADKWGNAKRYFDHIARQMERDRERYERSHADDVRAAAREYWDYTTIKVAMRGRSSGSKFANNHSD